MSSLSNNFNHLSSSLEEEVMVIKKQGIVSILGSDCERTKSIRRTLSADMSSKKWLSQNGFSSRLKKIASSEEFPVSIIADSSSSSEGEDEYEKETEPRGQFEIWTSIQEKKERKEPGQLDIWSSILTQKTQQETKNLPPPYIHPLVKRSASSLSEKSLEICTESLGSETGSDGFSSYPPSETGDAEEDKEEEQQQQQEERIAQNYDVEDWRVANYNLAAATKKSPPKTFPPPLPSLSRRDGASLHMWPRRDNGRLVLEAVSVPSQNNFKAQRQDGRLVLRFINSPNQEEEEEEGIRREEKNEMEMFEVEIENSEDEEKAEEVEEEVDERGGAGGGGGGGEEVRFMREQTPKLSSGVKNVHRLALMMNKPMVLANRNPKWSNEFNEIVKFEEEVEEVVNPITPMMQSLLPRPPVARMIPMPQVTTAAAATASFNVYEYYWKPKTIATATATAAAAACPITQKKPSLIRSKDNNNRSILSKNLMVNEKRQQLLTLRGNKGDCLVPLSKGCKEPRRSLLFWEPYCIATS